MSAARTNYNLGKYFWLLCALIALLILVPLFDDNRWGTSTMSIVGMVTLALALRAISQDKYTFYIGIFLGILAYGINSYTIISKVGVLITLPFQAAFYGFINLNILRSVLQSKSVTTDTVCGGICVYILLGINWAIIFAIIEFANPGSLRITNDFDPNGISQPMDFVYFSYVTLTTLGYGDIAPVSNAARVVSIACAISGTLFIAVFIGRLIGLTTAQAATLPDVQD